MKKWTNYLSIHISKNIKTYLILCGIFASGLCIGAAGAAVVQSDACESARAAITSSIKGLNDGSAGVRVFKNSFISTIKPLLLIWLAGFSSYGPWFIMSILGIKGIMTGFSAGVLIRVFDVKGVALSAAGILPQHLIILPLLIFLCNKGIEQSQSPRGGLLNPKARPAYARYALVLLAASLTAVFSAAVDAYVTSNLLRAISYMVACTVTEVLSS